MPYLFQVEVRESPVQGKGVFALEDIPENAVLWIFQSENPLPVKGYEVKQNRCLSQQQLQGLPAEEITATLHGGFYYAEKDVYVNLLDGSQFTNHTSEPNSLGIYPASLDPKDMKIVALRLIKKGEELLESYSNYYSDNSQWMEALMRKYCPEKYNLELKIHESEGKEK